MIGGSVRDTQQSKVDRTACGYLVNALGVRAADRRADGDRPDQARGKREVDRRAAELVFHSAEGTFEVVEGDGPADQQAGH